MQHWESESKHNAVMCAYCLCACGRACMHPRQALGITTHPHVQHACCFTHAAWAMSLKDASPQPRCGTCWVSAPISCSTNPGREHLLNLLSVTNGPQGLFIGRHLLLCHQACLFFGSKCSLLGVVHSHHHLVPVSHCCTCKAKDNGSKCSLRRKSHPQQTHTHPHDV